MSLSIRAKIVFGVDLGESQPFFTDGVDGGVYGWAEAEPQRAIMDPVCYNGTRGTILAVKGCSFSAKIDRPALVFEPIELQAISTTAQVDAFRSHLLTAGLEDVEPKWHLVCDA